MITKKFTPKRTVCKVTFSIPAEKASASIAVVGDFNNWDPKDGEMSLSGDAYTKTVSLKPAQEYKFKYYVDGANWLNDEAADAYAANEFGTEDSVLVVGE
ncbi:glycoside hydrolase [bacterium]|nr:MAG: glycoside hydrolase [bacterium]